MQEEKEFSDDDGGSNLLLLLVVTRPDWKQLQLYKPKDFIVDVLMLKIIWYLALS